VYNILIEFGIRMKLVTLIKMCLTETYSRVVLYLRIGKYLNIKYLNIKYLNKYTCMKFVLT
jgi:hypothetical protein